MRDQLPENPSQEATDEEKEALLADKKEEINSDSKSTSISGELDWDSLPLTELDLSNEILSISSPGTYVLIKK